MLKVYYCSFEQTSSDGSSGIDVDNPFGCGSQEQIVLAVVSSLLVILNFFLIFLNCIFLNDKNPKTNISWAHLSTSISLLKAIKKAIFIIGFTINAKYDFLLPTMIIYTLVCLCELYPIYYLVYMPSTIIQTLIITFEGTNAWMAILASITIASKVEMSDDIFYGLSIPIYGIFAWAFIEWRRRQSMFLGKISKFTEPRLVVLSNYLISYLYQNQHKSSLYILFQGVLTNHIRFCENDLCQCEQIAKMVERNIASSASIQKPMIEKMRQRSGSFNDIHSSSSREFNIKKGVTNDEEETKEDRDKMFYAFLRGNLESAGVVCGKKAEFYIEQGYINFGYFKNRYVAIYDFENARSCQCNILEDYGIFKVK